MTEKRFLFKNRIYTVLACTNNDIPSHTERVMSYWESTGTNLDTQLKLLEEAVEAQTAFKLVDDQGESKAFVYYLLNDSDITACNCHLLYFTDKRMLAMLCFYLRICACIETLYFMPHNRDFIPFEFLVEDYSIRDFYSVSSPLVIRTSSNKIHNLYETHFIGYGITEA